MVDEERNIVPPPTMQLHPHETIIGNQQAGRTAPELPDASLLLLSGVAAVSARDCEFGRAHPFGQLLDGRIRVAVIKRK
jgi:hypothetical protein